MHLLSRCRSAADRHPLVYWSLVAGLGLAAAGSLSVERSRVTAARDAWGVTRRVAVATRDLAPGDAAAVRWTELPVAAVPAAAATASDLGDEAVLVQHVGAGEVVTALDLGAGRLPLLPDGWVAVAIRPDPAPPARPGDDVVLLTTDGVLAERAILIDVVDGVLTVGVPATVAPAVADAARLQLLAIGLVRPDGGPG